MPRRKKLSRKERCLAWLKLHRRVSVALIILVLALCYLPLHAYRGYADNKKFRHTKIAMDAVYADIVTHLGQPDNVKSRSGCFKSHGLRNHISCSLETDFIYGLSTSDQAEVILHQIQKTISPKQFKPTKKLSAGLTDSLVFDTYYHGAMDTYRGPYGIDCSIKYSFDTPDEVNLSLRDPSLKPLEIFFVCSADSSSAIYPLF